MSPRPRDTGSAAWAVHNDVLDRMDGSARVSAAVQLSESVRDIRLAGIRARHPELSPKQVVARWVLQEYGLELADDE